MPFRLLRPMRTSSIQSIPPRPTSPLSPRSWAGAFLVLTLCSVALLAGAQRAGAQQSCTGGEALAAPFIIAPDAVTGEAATNEFMVVGTAGTSFSLMALSAEHDAVQANGEITDAGLAQVRLALANGAWLLGATVTDSCGNTSTPFNTQTAVDISAPGIDLDNATVDSSTLSVEVTSDRPAQVIVEVIDDSGVAVQRERVGVTEPGSTSVSFAVADGAYRLQAIATDDAGRMASTVLAGEPQVVDVTPPEVAVTAPVLSLDPGSVVVRVEAEAGAAVTVEGRGLGIAAEFVSTGVAREYNFATDPGDYTLDITAVDAMGNTFERSVRTRVRPEPAPMFSARVVGVVIAALLVATVLLWRWLRGREAEIGETGEAPVLRPQNA